MTGSRLGWLAIAIGIIAIGSFVTTGLYAVVKGPFGVITDVGSALHAILGAILALSLARNWQGGPMVRGAVGAACVGAGTVVLGSWLAISEATGLLLAGLVATLGFAFIGLWVIVVNRSAMIQGRWPRDLGVLGVVAGSVMAVGFFAIPTIAMRVDDPGTAPGWSFIGFGAWFGTFFLYSVWAILVGRSLISRGNSGG